MVSAFVILKEQIKDRVRVHGQSYLLMNVYFFT